MLSILTIVWKAFSLIFNVEDPSFILEDREIPVKKSVKTIPGVLV